MKQMYMVEKPMYTERILFFPGVPVMQGSPRRRTHIFSIDTKLCY